MWNGANNETQTFHCTARFSGQTDDEGFIYYYREIAREDCVLRYFHRLDAHDFAEPRQFADGDLAHRFWRDVSQCYSRPTGGQDELASFGDLLTNCALYVAFFIRHECFGC